MKRREFIKTGTAVGTGVLLGGKSSVFAMNPTSVQPNILFIMTDQQTAKAMSCAGNSDLKTPAMDFLAQHGHRFTRAYCPQPLCGPSRSSIFTGQMPHQVDATNNLPQIQGYWKEIPMMGKLMKEAGYDTGYVGKWHLPIPSQDKDLHGFDYMNEKTFGNWADPSIPGDCYEFMSKKRGNPYLLVASFTNPHDICEWARGQKLRQDFIGEVPFPDQCPSLPDNFEIPDNEPEIIREVQALSWKQYPTRDWKDNKWRQYQWAYNRLTEKVDYYIGMLIESLKKFNQLENTLIIFTSDHGDGCASHRWNQKQVLYEDVINVPFIMSWPEHFVTQTNQRDLVSVGQDIIPTMLDFAGLQKPECMKGLSLRSLIDEKNVSWRDCLVVETEFADGETLHGVSGRALISDGYKYTVYSKGKKRDQLFNLERDPGEMTDLVNHPSESIQLEKMKKLLVSWCETYNDSFLTH